MDKSRQQFEAWLVRNHSDTCNNINFEINSKGDYRYFSTRLAWEAWQASRESLINSLEPVGYIDNAESINLEHDRVCYLYKDSIDKINIPLYRLDK